MPAADNAVIIAVTCFAVSETWLAVSETWFAVSETWFAVSENSYISKILNVSRNVS